MGETTKPKPMTWTCLHCGVESPIGESHSGQVGCISALRVRLSAAERERDEAVASRDEYERSDAAEDAQRLAVYRANRGEASKILLDGLGSPAFSAAWGPELEHLGGVVDLVLADRDAAFARGVEAAAKVAHAWGMACSRAPLPETLESGLSVVAAFDVERRIRALSPATDAGKETT